MHHTKGCLRWDLVIQTCARKTQQTPTGMPPGTVLLLITYQVADQLMHTVLLHPSDHATLTTKSQITSIILLTALIITKNTIFLNWQPKSNTSTTQWKNAPHY